MRPRTGVNGCRTPQDTRTQPVLSWTAAAIPLEARMVWDEKRLLIDDGEGVSQELRYFDQRCPMETTVEAQDHEPEIGSPVKQYVHARKKRCG